MLSRERQFFSTLLIILLLQACRHPLAIEGEGDIVERNAGVRGCTLEEFQAGSDRCGGNQAVDEDYIVSYEAIPRDGWVFAGWEGLACSPSSVANFCDFSYTRNLVAFVDATWPNFPWPATKAVFKRPVEAAEQLFEEEIAGPVIEERCAICHKSGGISGFTGLVFEHGSPDTQAEANAQILVNFVASVDGGKDYLLTKVRGGNAHGGGSLFSAASDEYQALSNFLDLTSGDIPGEADSDTSGFWDGVTLADPEETLRRAALIVARRLPTAAEIALANSGEQGLRDALRGLLAGEGFHDFLINGANDRLLLDTFAFRGFRGGIPFDAIEAGADYFPEIARTEHELISAERYEDYDFWRNQLTYGFARAPLELIAHVVENDLPYTEILTADYTMANRGSAEVMLSGDLAFENEPEGIIGTHFLPAQNKGQVVWDENYQQERFTNGTILVSAHSPHIVYPHSGILSEHAYLSRYPSTDTNRNRARSRWTYYHFLGVDIEKSAGRTTDPDALADTNNPTLNNPNCVVCHRIMDPVAGAFQDFGDEGWYRTDGKNALPYLYEAGPLFEPGDLWYRDMLAPGFDGIEAPRAVSSIQWLGQTITRDPRFASGTVRFWWPALMGTDILEAPEVADDLDFTARLTAFENQQADINQMASSFAAGFGEGSAYNLKDLLIEMMMSNWFRAESAVIASSNRETELQDAGTRRLLTPQELHAKTEAALGVEWGPFENNLWPGGRGAFLTDVFNLYYGDIDSAGIVDRARELTPLMVNVAQAQALELACPAVILDINKPDAQRLLFQGIDRNMTPESDEAAIKAKLAEWHATLLGESVAVDSEELLASYDLLVAARALRSDREPWQWTWDAEFGEECFLPESFWQQSETALNEQAVDPEQMLGAWITVLIYFMTDYSYLHE